jgi:hypothetical protein
MICHSNGRPKFVGHGNKSIHEYKTDMEDTCPGASKQGQQLGIQPHGRTVFDGGFLSIIRFRPIPTTPIMECVELITFDKASIGGADTVGRNIGIYKNVNTCVDEEAVVMFRDRFFQWSFMSFIKKQNTTVNTRPQQAESIEGRFRYNVKSDEVLTLEHRLDAGRRQRNVQRPCGHGTMLFACRRRIVGSN